jgi:flagellar basal-body rod modification protein FlgD
MDSIQQIVTSAPQMASSANSVASGLTKPRTAAAAATSGTAGSTTSSSSATSASTITANDFLTLLVAEMKNQDPTQPTDPNAYITQMVNVNSLQQLIGINQGITTLDGAAGSGTSSSGNATSSISAA